MSPTCLAYALTETERSAFDRDGYFVLPDVLDEPQVARLIAATDRVGAEGRRVQGLQPHDRLSVRDFIHQDPAFVELVDWSRTFPKVWGILGWNIQVYHSHLVVTPQEPDVSAAGERDLKLSWHQDSGRVNWEMEGNPRPRISLKVAFFLTDTSTPDRGNFYVVPGSHKQNEVGLPNENRQVRLPDGVPVLAPRGSAVFFDRRIWHTASANFSPEPRRVLFYGYSYRWLRPRDELTAPGTWEELGPLRSQLFGASPTGGYGYTSPTPADVPLREWIREHAGEAAVAP